ncbi:L-arabinose transport system permease protein AraQ [compost metagenome]|uniref:carbohydrate ABC transporter permease n=1 Tax=Paenibacillus TaxID=44249 RepID=UPI000F92F3BD|nr:MULTISPECIES: carbohydrate ABC transporter permease [Paenibacillus]MBY9081084.1 carbohydrate ABC transporter permease [Paenibacillus sp. CGMCC 1.18879]MBY9087121.1 carbohydrate ABC transporter permease [Paenibacillus sinensis]
MKPHLAYRIGQHVIGYLFALLSLYPVFLMVTASFKTTIEIFTKPLSLPTKFSLAAYDKLLGQMPFGTYFVNSVLVSVVSVFLILLTATLASYYISRTRYKWNEALLFIFLLGMMIPIKLGIVPLFLLMKGLHLTNTAWSLILIYTAIGIPMGVMILSGFFRTLPTELEEAGRIDGCTDMQILGKIVVPLMRPALGTVMIINFVTAWNDFFFPLIFIQSELKKTIPVGLMSLFGEYASDWSTLFSGLTLASLPMILLFMFASRQFMDGMTAGAVK